MNNPMEDIEGLDPTHLRMLRIFYPFAYERIVESVRRRVRFVHYTSAETAMKILTGQEVWLRKSSVMNDFMEIEYGLGCLNAALTKKNERFKRILDRMFPGFSQELEERYSSWLPHFRTDTFIACLSEHDSSEDLLGRLSMWRAYGQPTGVAIVINGRPFMLPTTDALNISFSPVVYLSPAEFEHQLDVLLDRIEDEHQFVQEHDAGTTLNYVFSAFRSAVLCTKHPGFREEREWRLTHSPMFEGSERITVEMATIGGVPQPVCRVPLRHFREEGLVGLEIPALIDRIIIGPTDHPGVIKEAFQQAMLQSGFSDAPNRIVISDIPLRR
jgi:hypothetical protein